MKKFIVCFPAFISYEVDAETDHDAFEKVRFSENPEKNLTAVDWSWSGCTMDEVDTVEDHLDVLYPASDTIRAPLRKDE